jgi:hypothetical protein
MCSSMELYPTTAGVGWPRCYRPASYVDGVVLTLALAPMCQPKQAMVVAPDAG